LHPNVGHGSKNLFPQTGQDAGLDRKLSLGGLDGIAIEALHIDSLVDQLIEIRRIHYEFRQAYGALKIWKELKGRGIFCGKHRVARLRRLHGIQTQRKRRLKVTTDSRKAQWLFPNLLNRCFQTKQPNQVWVGDVTFIATRKGWLYLAVLLDLYSRKVIGWAMAERIDRRLSLDALEMALHQRKPETEVLHHTDRGSIYASEDYIQKEVVS